MSNFDLLFSSIMLCDPFFTMDANEEFDRLFLKLRFFV